jgi:ABC-type transport system involved in cytochrome bd biosynthesis fused ATPase/permease subunit
MDADTEQFAIDVLMEVKDRVGMLVISHKDSLTRIADRVYKLDGGVMVEVGDRRPIGGGVVV